MSPRFSCIEFACSSSTPVINVIHSLVSRSARVFSPHAPLTLPRSTQFIEVFFIQVCKPPKTPRNPHQLAKMSADKLPKALQATEDDIQLLLAAQCHLGTKNCDKSMENYVWKRRADG